jgi:lysophospholipase L1-like esterase
LFRLFNLSDSILSSPFADDFGGIEASEKSKQLAKYYQKFANQYNAYFMDAGIITPPNDINALHLTKEGHKLLAESFEKKIKEILN